MSTRLHITVGTLASIALVAAAQAASSAAPAPSAVLYGRLLRQPDQSAAAGHVVRLQCRAVDAKGEVVTGDAEATTDARGGYTMVVTASQRGSCRLWVEHQGRRSEPVEVFVGGSSLRYDLLLDAKFELSKR
jgi:curli biogenesis system outer membrane secretion channel CsgG